MSLRDIIDSMAADNFRDMERDQHRRDVRNLENRIEDLKMVCRRLAAAKTIAARDKIAKQCLHLFEGSVLRKECK